ncbi:MAG: hypothetical protein ABI723_25370 [Bacteroidia bacterium]
MKDLIQKINEIYHRFDRWFEKQFGWFFTNAGKSDYFREIHEE